MERFSDSESFFLSVLADHLNRRETSCPGDDIDWEAVMTLADHHEVRGMVYYQCRSFVSEPFRARLAELYAADLYYYQNRCRLYQKVASTMRAAGIPFFTVKGLDVARLYPVPALRTMGDCDLVVKSEDKERAHEVLIGLGFENENKLDLEWIYFRQEMEFELHHSLLYEELGNTVAQRVDKQP